MKTLGKIFLALSLTASCVFSQDKAMLDMFVEKGILTPQEAVELSKGMAANVVVHEKGKAKSIKIRTRAQFQYEWTNTRMSAGMGAPSSGASTSGFQIRRLFLELYADLGADWKAQIVMDFGRSDASHYIADTYVTKTFRYEYLTGDLDLGYRRPIFAYEEYLSSCALPAIERSVATTYFTGGQNGRRLGLGGRYVGAFYWGDVQQLPGLKYNVALVNSYNDAPWGTNDAYNTDDNIPNIIVGTEYVFKNDDWDIRAGVSGIYGDKANKKMGAGTAKSMYGVNPYIQGRYGNFYFWGDFLGAVVADGKNVGGEWRQASPYGLNASGEYRFDIGTFGKLGVTARYTWLDTGGRGISTKDAMRHYPSLSGDPAYNNVQAVYGGLNWYIRGDNLKLMLGYEWAQYSGTADDRHAAHRCDAQAFRTQLQIVF